MTYRRLDSNEAKDMMESKGRQGGKLSPEVEMIRTLEIGEGLEFECTGHYLTKNRISSGTSSQCRLQMRFSQEKRRSSRSYISRHVDSFESNLIQIVRIA